MEDDEFNFHIIIKSETYVAQQALQELFETQWDKKYPGTPWAKNAISVKLFEQNEYEHFQKSLEGLSKTEKGRKNNKRNRHKSAFKDDDWQNYEWDISKFAYALVDSKLFDFDETDDAGMPVSEHIVKIKDIRNETAHSRSSSCDNAYFTKTLNALGSHIKAFELVGLNVSKYLEELQRIKSQEKPVSSEAWFEMRLEFERLKFSATILQKENNHSENLWRLQSKHESEKKALSKVLQSRNRRLLSENKSLKQTRSSERRRYQLKDKILLSENKRLFSENESQTQTYSMELQRLKSEKERLSNENESQKQTHSMELQRLKSEKERLSNENESQKQTHSMELQRLKSEKERLSNENESQKQTHSEELQRLKSEKERLSNGRHLSESENSTFLTRFWGWLNAHKADHQVSYSIELEFIKGKQHSVFNKTNIKEN